jgi:hypothetical protein
VGDSDCSSTRFEFYFRLLSGETQWRRNMGFAISVAEAVLTRFADPRLKKPRVSSVSLAYALMRLGTSNVVSHCASLDRILCASRPTLVRQLQDRTRR